MIEITYVSSLECFPNLQQQKKVNQLAWEKATFDINLWLGHYNPVLGKHDQSQNGSKQTRNNIPSTKDKLKGTGMQKME